MRHIERYDVSTIERPTRADLEQLTRRRLDARRRGRELVLVGVGERLRLLLAVTGLDEVFLVEGATWMELPEGAPEPEGVPKPDSVPGPEESPEPEPVPEPGI